MANIGTSAIYQLPTGFRWSVAGASARTIIVPPGHVILIGHIVASSGALTIAVGATTIFDMVFTSDANIPLYGAYLSGGIVGDDCVITYAGAKCNVAYTFVRP